MRCDAAIRPNVMSSSCCAAILSGKPLAQTPQNGHFVTNNPLTLYILLFFSLIPFTFYLQSYFDYYMHESYINKGRLIMGNTISEVRPRANSGSTENGSADRFGALKNQMQGYTLRSSTNPQTVASILKGLGARLLR